MFGYIQRFICLIALLATGPAWGDSPLGVGDKIPDAFSARDSLGREARFRKLSGPNGLVLLFVRSADWCQYCKAQLRDWNEQVEQLEDAGYGLTALSYDSPELLNEFASLNQLRYSLLSDENSAMIEAFGIRNTKFEKGSRFYGIPNPTIYVFDDYGKITHVFREADYTHRPDIDLVMRAITDKP